jgi:hypothetical protein
MEFARRREFQRNEELEKLLAELNSLLEPVEAELLEDYRMPRYPVVFVVGAPRSGSTLLMQWLAHTGRFAYPTNLLSRFYAAPFVGAKIQQLLTAPEYSFRDELFDFVGEISFSSSLGKTKGVLAPNEFWYFWRRFIPNTEPRHLDAESLEKIRVKELVAELASIEAAFDKPLALKGMILELNIPFLSSILDQALFLVVKRHPFYTIQSLIESREQYFGDRRAWYSIKPKEYDLLKGLDPFEQVAGQVYFTNHTINEDLHQIDIARWLVVDYERFCSDPMQTFGRILTKFGQQGTHVHWDYTGPEQFHHTNQIRLPEGDCARIGLAYRKFSGEDIMPATNMQAKLC